MRIIAILLALILSGCSIESTTSNRSHVYDTETGDKVEVVLDSKQYSLSDNEYLEIFDNGELKVTGNFYYADSWEELYNIEFDKLESIGAKSSKKIVLDNNTEAIFISGQDGMNIIAFKLGDTNNLVMMHSELDLKDMKSVIDLLNFSVS